MAEITSTGIVQKTYEEYLKEYQDGFRSIFGDQMVFDPETPQGQITSLMALAASSFESQIIDIGRSLDIAQAQGQQLDDLTSILAVYRRDATKTTVSVTMTGLPLTLIRAGSEVASVDAEVFVLSEDIQLDGNGTGTGLFIARNTGSIPVAVGEITEIVTPVRGWTAVTNSVAGTTGAEAETDAELSRRYFNQIAVASTSLMDSVVSGVQAISGVTHAVGVENNTDTISVINGVNVPAHGFAVAVVGGADSDVASAIRRYKSLGSSSIQKVLCTLTGVDATLIPAGSQAYIAAADNTAGVDLYFELINDETIPPSTTIDAYMRCITEAAFEFDALKTMVIKGNWRDDADWSTGVAYIVDDRVYYGVTGRNYKCILNVTGAYEDPTDGTYWVLDDEWSACTNKSAHRFVHRNVDALASDGTLIQSVPIDFLRVQEVEVYVHVESTSNSLFPLDGIEQITANILSYFNGGDVFIPDRFELDGLSVGENVYKARMYTPANSVRGHNIINVTLQLRYADWVSQDYLVGDKVFYLANNKQYVCTVDTTTQQVPTDGAYWALDTGVDEYPINLDERAVISEENIVVSMS